MTKYMTTGIIVIILFFGSNLKAKAQGSTHTVYGAQTIPARNLFIGQHKTCMLVFPAKIQSADRGAAYVLAERVKGSENVLKVKAGKKDFMPSSLTVLTTDGQVFAFKVLYAQHPPYLALDLSSGISGKAAVRFSGTRLNSAEMHSAVVKVKKKAAFLKGVRAHKYGLDCQLEGIYIHQGVLFFKFRLRNTSNIGYNLASLRFFIRDLKTARRTAVQDNELKPLYMQSWDTAEEQMGQEIVVAMPRFTIADDKNIKIEFTEKAGDRVLSLRLKERKLRKTRSL